MSVWCDRCNQPWRRCMGTCSQKGKTRMAKPEDRVDLDEVEFDDAQAMTHASGIQQGMMRAISYLRQSAGDYFQRDDDQTAKMIRAMAKDLEEKAETVYIAPDPSRGKPWQGEGKLDACAEA